MNNTIKVEYKSTANVVEANKWLREISEYPIIGCDFEVAIKYTDEELAQFKLDSVDESLPKLTRMQAAAKLSATALDHPSHTVLTHLQIAISETESYVFVLANQQITNRVLSFLTTTEQKQIWHNAGFDFKHIYYRTGKFPKNYEDSQIYSKCLLNHVEISKAKTGLKELAGHAYGSWGISSDNFTVAQMFEEVVLKYAAIDPCATLWVWNQIINSIESEQTTNYTIDCEDVE